MTRTRSSPTMGAVPTLALSYLLLVSRAHGSHAFIVGGSAQSATTTRKLSGRSSTSGLRRAALTADGRVMASGPAEPRQGKIRSRLYSSQSPSPEMRVTDSADDDVQVADTNVTDLPDSFEDSVVRMGKATLRAMDEGLKLLRIDFDTSAGDETYTTLKSSLEMAKQLTKLLAEALIVGGNKENSTDATLALFFPDAGSAALAKYEWGAGTETAQVPVGVRFCTVKTEAPVETDVGCIVLCPQNSEADTTLELVKKVVATDQFMILVNPELINMGTTGYGLAGRRIRDEVISAFQTTYYLRTLPWGAVTREHGKWYSVWQDDANDPTGYRLLKNVPERPVADELDDIYSVANGLEDEDSSGDLLDSVAKFVRDFGRL